MTKIPSLKIKRKKKAWQSGRAFFLSSEKVKASMAGEGSLVLPLFLFFMMTVLLSLETVRFQSDLAQALHQAGNKSAFTAYQVKYAGSRVHDTESHVREYLGSQIYPYHCVEGGESGVAFRDLSAACEDGRVELLVEYRIKPFIRWLPVGDVKFKDRFLGHAWTGYWGNEGHRDETKEDYVYVTKTGSKYHMSQDCTYLRVKVQAVDYGQMEFLRNQSGGKYYPCLRCRPVKRGMVYITADGGSFHSQSDCSSLKRTVYMLPLSEAEKDYDACGKCG